MFFFIIAIPDLFKLLQSVGQFAFGNRDYPTDKKRILTVGVSINFGWKTFSERNYILPTYIERFKGFLNKNFRPQQSGRVYALTQASVPGPG